MNEPHIPRSLRNQVEAEQKPVTRAEAREWIAAGSIAGMKKVYEQLAEESEKHFEQMEAILQQRMTMEFERRSWRGRWVRLRQRVVGASLRLLRSNHTGAIGSVAHFAEGNRPVVESQVDESESAPHSLAQP